MSQQTRTPGPDEQFCMSCGEVIARDVAACPSCGAETEDQEEEDGDSLLGKTGYTALGGICGLISFIVIPIVFGPIAMFCGYKVYQHHSERLGIGLMVLGGAGLIVGTAVGLLMSSAMA